MRGKPGYEHLNEPLHILVEAELPVEIVDARLMQAREILEDLLRPMVKLSFASQILCFFCPLELLHPYLVVFLFDFVIRMNPRISTRNSSCGSWQCWTVPFVTRVRLLLCLARFLLSTTVSGWRGPRPGGDRPYPWRALGACVWISASKQRLPFTMQKGLLYQTMPLLLPSGHWHYLVPVLTCFYIKCVYSSWGRFNDSYKLLKEDVLIWEGLLFCTSSRQFGQS